jgi:integral membrane protein (TIGR01906 family)
MRKTLIVIASVLLFAAVFTSSFASLVFDREFYINEHEKNGVMTALGNSTAIAMTDELISYLHGDGELSALFNERERQHLADVQQLMTKGLVIHYIILFLLIGLFVYFYFQTWFLSATKQVFLWTGGAVITFSLLSFALQGLFERAFLMFHQVLFTNDLWLLNPKTDMLIVLLPQRFFLDFVTAVYLESLSVAVLLVGLSALLHLISQRGNEAFK